MGLVYAWVAPTIRQQQGTHSEFNLSNDQCSWIGSLADLGRIFGPFMASLFINQLGRRITLITCTIVFFAVWPAVLFVRSVEVIYASRFVFGLVIGLNDVCSSIYVGENCRPNLRAIFSSISILVFYAGELVEFALATYFSYTIVASVNSIITFLSLSCILVTTETPHYLITKKKLEKAEKNFNWLRGRTDSSDEEFEKLKTFVEQEQNEKISFKELLVNKMYFKPVLLILILCFFMMMTGFSAITSFVSIAFSESDTLTPNQFVTLYGLCQFIAVCASPFIVERFNRRTILISSFAFVTLIHTASAALYYAKAHGVPVPFSSWLLFATISLYSMTFSCGLHPIFYTIRGELFPQNVKAIGGSVAIIGHSVIGFLSSKMFLIVAEAYGMYTNFLTLAISSAIAILYVYACIPETKGKTLAEIQQELRGQYKSHET